MDNLKMHTPDKTKENYEKLAALFPNAVTETIVDGEVVRAIDADVLRQEISETVVECSEERYQFTWPDKKKSVLLANSHIAATLRPCREESVDFDNTENLYIEGDNLDVLKLLQETYLGKIKMIYIDPPYNTGNDFVYNDDFAEDAREFLDRDYQYDEDGNRMVRNLDSNGRFHTDWLNMIYPRLRLARDLLTEDGVIFISIDDNEVDNLKKICNEVFGALNFVAQITRATGTPTGGGFDVFVNELDYILVYAKNIFNVSIIGLDMTEEDAKIYNMSDKFGKYLIRPLRRTGGEDRREDRPTMYFPLTAPDGSLVYPIGPTGYESRWICGKQKYKELVEKHLIEWKNDGDGWRVYQKFYLENRKKQPGNLWNNVEGNKKATRDVRTLFDGKKVFDYPKPIEIVTKMIGLSTTPNSIILDFFSGSATTAHAVMQFNAEDGGKRKFIMVQLPEAIDENSEAAKAGYKNICEIGKERIRRAGKKIKEESPLTTTNLDIGFRVLKLDSSNMKEVYYTPDKYELSLLDKLIDNIKEDRTPEDLLFQVMLDLGVLLSSKIEQRKIGGKTVFSVEENFLIACFENDVGDDTIKEIAKLKPYYAVFRDSSFASDSVAANFEQIFATYSPSTVRRVL